MAESRTLDRRDFVRLTVIAGSGLVLGGAHRPGAGTEPFPATDFEPSPWLRIAPDGRVTIWMARADMGQGVTTALPMVVADELEADWASVTVVRAEAHPSKYGRQMTVGSTSVRRGGWSPLRQAGAAAREMLVAAAAARFGVPASACEARQGRVHHRASGRSASFGELAAAASALPVPGTPTLKRPEQFRLIGTRVPQRDLALKVTGAAGFGMDVRVPGLLYATVVRCPTFGGTARRVDDGAALAVPGVRRVVAISSGIAVVATGTWAAFEGAKALRVEWDRQGFALSSAELTEMLDRRLAAEGAVAAEEGDVAGALPGGRRVTAEYDAPFLAHATMEPMNCTAHVQPDRCEIWVPTQNPQGAQAAAARITGLPADRVAVRLTYLGCGWGRRGAIEYVEDAVETSKAVGAPVQLVWTREEDMRHDNYRPRARCRFEGAVDSRGRIVALTARVASTPIGGRSAEVDRNGVDGIANPLYRMPALRVESHPVVTKVPIGYWRSVGPSHNAFFLESFVDELAHAAGRDPVAVRRELLAHDPRALRVLDLAAEKAGWSSPPPSGVGRGVALVQDKDSIVAQVAEVAVEGSTIRVRRVVCAADCGQVVHPGIVEAQMEGSVAAGLGAALGEEITLDNGGARQSNFHDYPLLRISAAPRVEVHLVPSHDEPGSAGEPGLPPIAPAVANAFFALTGTRLRRLPLRLG
ncbi:MAG: molybdopterin cofactor-binding domain-containing protein [Gemmatimonadales bacterium]